jgi:hypothetical protein
MRITTTRMKYSNIKTTYGSKKRLVKAAQIVVEIILM